jgi:hypothetical protein
MKQCTMTLESIKVMLDNKEISYSSYSFYKFCIKTGVTLWEETK